jgi:hypothetical protein
MTRRIAHAARIGALVLALTLVPAALAAKGGDGGGGSTSSCTPSAPRASIDNSVAWATPGSWGTPGQQLKYAINVFNTDAGCSSSSFVVKLSAPSGFSVSIPSSAITLSSSSSGYVWAYVTSPTTAADGSYPLTATVERAGTTSAPASSSYKVYSSDTSAPKLYWMNPSDGGALSGRTAYVGLASSDDHAVKQLDVYVDGVSKASKLCDNVSYDCQLSYKWSIRRVHGQHTATFTSTDWMGNVASQTSTFTVN